MDSEATGIGASGESRLLAAKAHESADLERNPRSEVSVPIPQLKAGSGTGDDKQKSPLNGKLAESLLVGLRLSCRKRPDLPKDFADSFPVDSEEAAQAMSFCEFAFHDHSGPLILENKIIDPDSWHPAGILSEEEESKQHKYIGPQHLHLFQANGIYQGVFDTNEGSPEFSGYGLWVSASSFQGEGAKKGGHYVTILWGKWEGQVLAGSMLHAYMPEMDEDAPQRCVGFSYKGFLSLKCHPKVDKKGASTSQTWQELIFHQPKLSNENYGDDYGFATEVTRSQDPKSHGQSETAIFREFEFAVPFDKKSKQWFSQVWVELFFDTLSDDGLERKDSRDFEQHKQDSGYKDDQEGFIKFLKSNYIGAGLQYFVPRVVDGMHALCEIYFIIGFDHNHHTVAHLLCRICEY